ncbi:MFS transporter [Lentilactobacillus hilgardii]|uniref:MFS transporter n=1 Tax=Lentilactobacillus hilgardii TaxID=1588 RepID=UPI0021A6E70C|nr:MFS transporter [Lentilactobacillus hilgardii]MCT3399881.1 MFS transporter [Lentilactobacillus hilgardii]
MTENTVSIRTKLAILATGLLSFIGILVETSLNVTFPTMMVQFHTSLSTVQWLTSGYLLMVTIVMSTTAFLIKHYHTRTLFRVAIIATLLGTILSATAPSFLILMIGRILQAVATGLSTPLMFHVILSLIPQSRLGVYMGIASMITSFAPALGPTYGGLLNFYFNWRMIFIITLPLIIIIGIIGEYSIRLQTPRSEERFDLKGLILLSLVFFGFIETFDQAGNTGFISLNFGLTFLITIGFLLVLLHHIQKGSRQILNFKIFTDPIISLRAINFFLLQFINIGISFVIPVFAQNYLGADSMISGLILLPGSLIGAIVAPVAGSIYDRRGPEITLYIANGSMMIGSLLLWWLTKSLNLFGITLLYIFLRFGFNFGFGNIMSDASQRVSLTERADLNSLFNTLQQYAGSIGTGVLSAIISVETLHISAAKNGLATASGSKNDFLLLGIFSLVGLVTTSTVSRIQRHKKV